MSSPAEAYARLAAEQGRFNPSAYFAEMTRLFAEEHIWQSYDELLLLSPDRLVGAAAVDIGCKYGHTLPLFLARGAAAAIGVDVEPEYLEEGRRILGVLWPQIQLVASDRGLLPLASESTDLVLLNEVISHVNPMYLDNLYGEIARILRPGGVVIVSDGNNAANAECRRDLVDVWDAWENGPAGRRTGRDVVTKPFVERRREIIAARLPQLSAEAADRLAHGTFGLFGEFLDEVLDRYAKTGVLIERRYRPGLVPTSPGPGGAVMERSFHPVQVEFDLARWGIRAAQVLPPPRSSRDDLKGRLIDLYLGLRHELARRIAPETLRGANWGFQVVGTREA